MDNAYAAYLARTDEELKLYIDPAHMSYLPVYLGRADARHSLGEAPEAVLRELWLAAQVYQGNGGVFLTKWPHSQLRRRRLEPLEVALVAGDAAVLKSVVKTFGIEPMLLFAGIEPDDVAAEVKAVTSYFQSERVSDALELAGTLAIFYATMLSALGDGDAEGFEAARRRALRLVDDQGHLLGGIAAGGIARIRVVHEALAALRPARPELLAQAIVRHGALHAIEVQKSWEKDAEAKAEGRGALDRTGLCLLVVAKSLGVELAAALAAGGADAAMLAYAEALGHTRAP